MINTLLQYQSIRYMVNTIYLFSALLVLSTKSSCFIYVLDI